MKNMFLVINKEKVYAYIVSVFTIVALFFMSDMINSNFTDSEETFSDVTSINVINNENVVNIYENNKN